MSTSTIMASGVANIILNVPRNRMGSSLPMIDWDLVMIMEPSAMVGALVGGYLNKVSTRCVCCSWMPASADASHVLPCMELSPHAGSRCQGIHTDDGAHSKPHALDDDKG